MKKTLSSNLSLPVLSSQSNRMDCKYFAEYEYECIFISGFTGSTVSKPKHKGLIIKATHKAAHHD